MIGCEIRDFSPTISAFSMSLSLQKASNTYFEKLFGGSSGLNLPGAQAKVLLLDSSTTGAVLVCWTQLELLAKDVVLVETINRLSQLLDMRHLNCVVYVSPELVDDVCRELQAPHYGNYRLFFNNQLSKQQVEKLATADLQEKVVQVMEIFQDYLMLNEEMFLANLPQNLGSSAGSNRQGKFLEEATLLTSLLLLLRQCPVVRYEQTLQDLRRLSLEVLYAINSNSNNSLFDDLNRNKDTPPVLLLVDRKSDPITPLLSPWTYQAMIHELIGIKKNIVRVDDEQLTLLAENDEFFRGAMYLNYGDLTDKVQKYVEEYKKQTKTSINTTNLAELKNFLSQFPEFRKLLSNVSKHLNIVSEIDRRINTDRLWEVGELQQVIVGNLESRQTVNTRMLDILTNNGGKLPVPTTLKVKLVLIFALATDREDELQTYINILGDPQVCSPPATILQLALLRLYHKYLPTASKTGALEPSQGLKKLSLLFSSDVLAQKQADNIYMQHVPLLSGTLLGLLLPNTGSQSGSGQTQQNSSSLLAKVVPEAVTKQYGKLKDVPLELIVYIHGGVTYEEARLINEMNASGGVKVVIGGDKVLNLDEWLKELEEMVTAGETNVAQEVPRREQLRDIL